MFGGYITANLKYQEILKLDRLLTEADIPHVLKRRFDGWQVCYPGDGPDTIMDAIEHRGSYGRDDDLLEIMGLLTPEEAEYDSVLGNLTAEDVFERICKHYAESKYPPHTCINPLPNERINEVSQEKITHCKDCGHCFESRRSKTGYACEVWGYDDFACDTTPDGYCHKAKPKGEYR